MAFDVVVICRPELAPGFALAGLDPITVEHEAEAAQRLRALAADSRTGVVLVQQELIPGEPFEKPRTEPLPMIVPFPGPSAVDAEQAAAAYIAEILRRAVGYRVKLA